MNHGRAICWTIVFALAACARISDASTPDAAEWDRRDALELVADIERIAADGLDPQSYDRAPLTDALAAGDRDGAAAAAAALFDDIAQDIRTGIIPPEERRRWNLPAPTALPDIIGAENRGFAERLASLAPQHPQYQALRNALAAGRGDAEDAARLRLNMERWRWMPRELGPDYIFVNVPAFELIVVRGGEEIDRRRVIVGTRRTPTPQFAATVTAVAFNPTWFVPPSIVAESVGAFLRDEPDKAAKQGYYAGADGGVRQKPGPANAIGQMKLIMPNPYSVFLHDTPSKGAFARDDRALSHGCVRVDGAVDFARVLLGDAMDEDAVAKILSTRITREIGLERPIPIYVTYFTAYADKDGTAAFYPDIYGLDRPLLARFGGPPADAAPKDETTPPVESCPEAAPAQ